MKTWILIVLILVFIVIAPIGVGYNPFNRTLAILKVWDRIEVDFEQLSPSMSEADLALRYSDIKWDCRHDTLADRACFSHVRQINRGDAWLAVFFFDKDRLVMGKFDFDRSGHRAVTKQLEATLGKPRGVVLHEGQGIGWKTQEGVLVTTASPSIWQSSQMLWLSHAKVLARPPKPES